jgi:Ser/Thr protein kinase RdoA (MazF antagonist)
MATLVAAGAVDDASASAATALLADAAPRLAARAAPNLVHADLNVSNLLVDDDGAVGLIDFERARGGHWVYDTVKLFSETFAGCPECIRAFADGYGIDVDTIRDDARVYRLVYSVDMAAYLLGELHGPEDHALLARLLAFIRRPHDPWTDG